jgi:hypothetical protein
LEYSNTPPKVVFIGDYITYFWPVAATNPNWINQGVPGYGLADNGGATGANSSELLASFQASVVSLHPAVVHIMVGSSDSLEVFDSNYTSALPTFLSNINTMVQEANAANIKVILGTAPCVTWAPMNYIIETYGAANNIPVVNYAGTLCGNSIGLTWASQNALNYSFSLFTTTTAIPGITDPVTIPSTQGYSLMSQMAQSAISAVTTNPRLEGGYLQNQAQPNDNVNIQPPPNENTVVPGTVLQFTPVGWYSDGSVQTLWNSNFLGSNGTWTSSNPLVMSVTPSGQTMAISPGTSIIRYTSPSGIAFSEWIMYVQPGGE